MPINREIKISMNVDANTESAKRALKELSSSLDSLTKKTISDSGLNISSDVQEALPKVVQLQAALENCKNKTGGLDLSKFNESLAKSNTSIQDYAKALGSLGPEGTKAFSRLAQSIITAEVPMKRTSKLLSEFKTTLANTAKWQFSSTILHGFMGSVQSAIGYVEDLNESLTNIRIVTGHDTEYMADFAKKANEAAKALSTTTTAYTDAALIFYQQGLSDSEVTERTNATIKMAHATGDSATEVSSYMTAIWNNFDDGSESLEHYADVITALGASTASSSSEIAEGLSKFAAIAETTGLSYEYATASLATLVANTRQSADTIGTSLKTIFSRLQGLSLGETLEDGVDLNKYSTALNKVGVSVLDTNGDLKDMDDILDDLAAKWDTITDAQKMALSQTVAGVRQYSVLMSLMDNWDDMTVNLDTANDSDGTLQEQADIYAESWDAAKERVAASAQEIYSQLLNDDFFIAINNGFAQVLNTIGDFIDTLGGLKGLLPIIGAFMLQAFGPNIDAAISRIRSNLQNSFQQIMQLRSETNSTMKDMLNDGTRSGAAQTDSYNIIADFQDKIIAKQYEFNAVGQELTAEQNTQIQKYAEILSQMADVYNEAQKELEVQEEITEQVQARLKQQYSGSAEKSALLEDTGKLAEEQKQFGALNKVANDFQKEWKGIGKIKTPEFKTEAIEKFQKKLQLLPESLETVGVETEGFKTNFEELNKTMSSDDIEKFLNSFSEAVEERGAIIQEEADNIKTNAELMGADDLSANVDTVMDSNMKLGASLGSNTEKMLSFKSSAQQVNEELDKTKPKTDLSVQSIGKLAGSLATVAMAASSAANMFKTLTNPDASGFEKFISVLMTASMIVPLFTNALKEEVVVQNLHTLASIDAALGLEVLKNKTIEEAIANQGLAATLWEILAPLLTLIAPILILIAAFAALVAIIKVFQGASPEEKLKAAKETASELSEALSEAKQEAESLQSAFNSYDEVIETLDSCTKYTEEWYEALQKVNEEVLDLITEYPELAANGYLSTDSDGVMTISEDGKQAMLDASNQRVAVAQAASIRANQNVRNANIEILREDALNAIAGKFPNVSDDEDEDEYNDNQREYYSDVIKSNTISLDGVAELEELGIDISELTSAVNENTIATRSENEAISRSLLSDNDVVQNSAYKDELLGVSGEIYGNAFDKAIESLEYADWGQKGISKASTEKDEDAQKVFKEYLEAAGINENSVDLTGVTGIDSNRRFVYLDSDNNEQTVSLDAMKNTVAASKAEKELEEKTKSLNRAFADLDTKAGDSADALIEFVGAGGSFENATQAELNEIQKGIDEAGSTKKYLNEKYGGDDGKLSNEEAQMYGFDNASEMIKKFDQALSDYDESMKSVTDDMSTSAKALYNEIDGVKDLSLSSQKDLSKIMQEAFNEGGSEGASQLKDLLKTTFKDKPEEIEKFTQALSGIDWDTATIADFRNALTDAGIDVFELGIDVEEIFDIMSSRGKQTLESIQETYKSLQDITKDMVTGDTVSAEDYATLADQLGSEFVDGYFAVMADGTYKLVGDAKDFYEAVQAGGKQGFLDNIQAGIELNRVLTNGNGGDEDQIVRADDITGGNIEGENQANVAAAYLDTLELTEEEEKKLAEIRESYQKNEEYSQEDLEELNDLMKDRNISEEQWANLLKENQEYIKENSEAYLSSAESLAELDANMATLYELTDDGKVSGYWEALIGLASGYDNCADEIEEYQKALASGNDEQIEATENALRASIAIGELSEKYNLVAEDIETQAKLLKKNRKELNLTDEQAANLAAANQRMNRGVSTLNENFSDWKDILNSSNHTTQEYAEALNDANEALADLVGAIDYSKIPLEFLDSTTAEGAQHLQWLEQAANGDTQAINLLGSALAVASVDAMEFNESYAQAFADAAGIDVSDASSKFEKLKNEVTSNMQEIHDAIANGLSADEIQSKINAMEDGWVEGLNQMAIATGMGVDEMNSLLNEMGVQAEVKTVNVKQKTEVPIYTEYYEGGDPVTFQEGVNEDGEAIEHTYTPVRHYTVSEGTKEVEGYVPVAQIGTVENSKNPNISTLTYTGTSGASRGGGVSSGSTSRGSSRSSGSSSSRSRSDKDRKTHRDIEGNLKELSEEIERYHEINNTIDDINENLDDYNNIADRAFGNAKVKALKEQVKAYKDLASAINTKLNENAAYLATDKKNAKKYGWTFDADGNVNNYDEQMKKLVNRNNAAEEAYLKSYNAAVNWWNSLSADAQGEDSNKKKYDKMIEKAENALEDANQLYEDAIAALDQYEETKELREDLLKEQKEALQDAVDAELEAVDTAVQVRLDLDDADIKLLEELIDGLGDDVDNFADAIAYLGKQMPYLRDSADAATTGIKDTLSVYTDKDIFGSSALKQSDIDNIMNGDISDSVINKLLNLTDINGNPAGITEETINQLREYQDELYESNEAMRQLREDALSKTADAFDEFTEDLDRASEKIEHFQKVTETYKNIIDIVGKRALDSTGQLTNRLSRANWELQRNNTHALKSELDFIDTSMDNVKSMIADLESTNVDGVHDETIKEMQEQLKDMEDTRDSTYESWLDSWEAEFQAAADIYSEILDNIVQDFSDSLAGALGSLDVLSEAFERKSEIDDIYLDDYEKIYDLSKLTRDIEASIDDTDNVRSKQALKDLLEEINELQEDGVELSEYDIENARRRYELELARQQLLDAQNSKTTVRMTRDSEGNYGYMYTADENAVAEAEQNYEDKLYEMQQANAEYIKELQDSIVSAEQECADALADLDATQFASYEEFQNAIAAIQADYTELMEGYYQQMNNALENNKDLYENEWQEYSDMTDYKISADEDFIDAFNETQLAQLTGFETMEEAQDVWNQSVVAAVNDAKNNWFDFATDTEIAMSDGETSMEEYGETVEQVALTVEQQGQEMENVAEDMADTYVAKFKEILDAMEEFESAWGKIIDNITTSNNQLNESINKLIASASELKRNTDANGDTKISSTSSSSTGTKNDSSSSGSSASTGSSNSSKSGSTTATWDRIKKGYDYINLAIWGTGASRYTDAAKYGYTKAEVDLAQKLINYVYPSYLGGQGLSMAQAKKLMGYDTGGYTGQWNNNEGRLALLHQKEIVLNDTDTANFLKAVDMVREISQTIDLNALSTSGGLSATLASASLNGNTQELEQNITITAEFPNAQNRTEIEAAFDNLINRAAQFANRKN